MFERRYNMKCNDLIGNKYGMLTVIKRADSINGRARWFCACDCGKECIVYGQNLKKGFTKSCGCNIYKNRAKTAKNLNPKLYRVWKGMRERCYKEKTSSYPMYGGRGISVCEEWKNNYDSFYKWAMENGYKDGLSIDRKNTNGNYEPSNCRWATPKEQARNTRRNVMIEINGTMKSLPEWCEDLGIPYDRVHGRYERMKKAGVPIDVKELLSTGKLKNIPYKYTNRKESQSVES